MLYLIKAAEIRDNEVHTSRFIFAGTVTHAIRVLEREYLKKGIKSATLLEYLGSDPIATVCENVLQVSEYGQAKIEFERQNQIETSVAAILESELKLA